MKKRIPNTHQEWLTHAESDLNLAKLGQDNSSILPEQVCFHVQQAAEKSLKAVLLFLKLDFPLTHDLEELVAILKTSRTLPPFLDESGMLTPYAVETRYPGFWGEITVDDVRESLELSEQILNWAHYYIAGE